MCNTAAPTFNISHVCLQTTSGAGFEIDFNYGLDLRLHTHLDLFIAQDSFVVDFLNWSFQWKNVTTKKSHQK